MKNLQRCFKFSLHTYTIDISKTGSNIAIPDPDQTLVLISPLDSQSTRSGDLKILIKHGTNHRYLIK